jgi:PTH1 family peptidyl-tRNA hydrolase
MNDSGRAVQEAASFFKLVASEITVFQDELELPPAKVRVKVGGGIAGHNGLRSISSHLHSQEFLRVRIGVGKPPSAAKGASHVLQRPPRAVREVLETAVQTAADSVERLATDGIDAAMAWCHSLPT